VSLAELDPRFRPWAQELVHMADRMGMRPRVTSTRRSLRAQTVLWERWQRVLRGELPPEAQPYPVAPPGQSAHGLGLAIDLVVSPEGASRVLGDWWRAHGGQWWPSDAIHFEAGPDQLRNKPRITTTAPEGHGRRERTLLPPKGPAGGCPPRSSVRSCCR